MSKSKHRKNHKQKLNHRKNMQRNQINTMKKYESEIMKRIQQEADSGAFTDVKVITNEVENNDLIL